jgi:hypothetical protein
MKVVTVKDLREYLNRPDVSEDTVVLPLIASLENLSQEDSTKMMNFIQRASKDHFLKCRMGIVLVAKPEGMSAEEATSIASTAFFFTHN